MNKRLLQISALSLSLFAIPAIAQKTYHVKINGNDSNDGLKWSTAFKNIQSALDVASEGDTVKVSAGTYYPTLNLEKVYGGGTDHSDKINCSFLLKKNIKLYGGFPANASDATTMNDREWTINQTILSGDFNNDDGDNFENTEENAIHVVVMIKPSSNMLIDGFHITGGGGDEDKIGSSIYVDGTLVDQRCGGGIYAFNLNSEVSPVLSNLNIRNNKAAWHGGGIYNHSETNYASPTLTNVTMTNNLAKKAGGGALLINGMNASPKLQNVNITGNEALEGGGFACIAEEDCSPTLENVLISGNKANKSAGVYIWAIETNAKPVITNTTICGNRADTDGGIGGLFILANGDVSPQIKNSVIWGNKSTNIEGDNIYLRSVYGEKKPIYTYSFIENMDLGETNLNGNTDPMFVNPIDADFAPTTSDFGDYQLQPTSPLINKGNNADNSLPYDLAGQDRIYGDIIDIGTYEAQDIDLVDNEKIITDRSIWSHQNNLHVRISNNTATVRIYSINGMLIKQVNNLGEGTHTLTLPNGLYIVTLSTGKTTKISIR
ncbi:MAG: T9SS type A sorting domain-containing protein [Tannerella sp.]|jgi:hypothetical protein|nr:T9SS type A sorting domain-containing protein [Tannerella sp.]